MKTLEIHFGALAGKIEKQLEKQGLKLEEESRIEIYERSLDGIRMLFIHGMMTETEYDKITKRFFNKISKEKFASINDN